MEEKILEILLEKTEAGKTTYKEVNEMIALINDELNDYFSKKINN